MSEPWSVTERGDPRDRIANQDDRLRGARGMATETTEMLREVEVNAPTEAEARRQAERLHPGCRIVNWRNSPTRAQPGRYVVTIEPAPGPEPVITAEDVAAINAARDALAGITERARKASWAASRRILERGDYVGQLDEATPANLGAVGEAADIAEGLLFNVLNVARSTHVVALEDDVIHNRRPEEAAEPVEMLRDKTLVDPPATEQSGPQPDEAYVGDEPGPDLSDATEHDWRL